MKCSFETLPDFGQWHVRNDCYIHYIGLEVRWFRTTSSTMQSLVQPSVSIIYRSAWMNRWLTATRLLTLTTRSGMLKVGVHTARLGCSGGRVARLLMHSVSLVSLGCSGGRIASPQTRVPRLDWVDCCPKQQQPRSHRNSTSGHFYWLDFIVK